MRKLLCFQLLGTMTVNKVKYTLKVIYLGGGGGDTGFRKGGGSGNCEVLKRDPAKQ